MGPGFESQRNHQKIFIPHFCGIFYFSYTISIFSGPGGEIGRRTILRGWRPKGCMGSNPIPGTRNLFIHLALLATVSDKLKQVNLRLQ